MNESTTTPGLCARCGRDPAENGAKFGEDWYCLDAHRRCYLKTVIARAATRGYFNVTDYSPEGRAAIERRLGGLS